LKWLSRINPKSKNRKKIHFTPLPGLAHVSVLPLCTGLGVSAVTRNSQSFYGKMFWGFLNSRTCDVSLKPSKSLHSTVPPVVQGKERYTQGGMTVLPAPKGKFMLKVCTHSLKQIMHLSSLSALRIPKATLPEQ
jgi:hypothetical protein